MRLLINDTIAALSDLYQRRDPALAHLPLAGTPLAPVALLATYVWLVFVGVPRHMGAEKPAYSLRRFMLVYNAGQVAANAFMTLWCIDHALTNWRHIYCLPTLPANTFGTYLYYLNKWADLVETPVFVLRRKQQQVSFLHVYHHLMVVSCAYVTMLVQPGAHIWFYGLMNCLVHTAMYAYYFCSTYDRALLVGARWLTKRNVTRLQLAQFVLVSAHLAVPAVAGYCDYSGFLTRLGLFQCNVMMVLFARFYYKTYMVETKDHRTNGDLNNNAHGKSKRG